MIHLVRSGLISASLLRAEIKGLRDTKKQEQEQQKEEEEIAAMGDVVY